MIKIIAKNYIKNDKKEIFLKLAKELIAESRKENGCIAYDIYEGIDGRSLTFIEEWKDEKAIESHNNSNHFKTIVPKLAEFVDGEMDVSLYKKIDFTLLNISFFSFSSNTSCPFKYGYNLYALIAPYKLIKNVNKTCINKYNIKFLVINNIIICITCCIIVKIIVYLLTMYIFWSAYNIDVLLANKYDTTEFIKYNI